MIIIKIKRKGNRKSWWRDKVGQHYRCYKEDKEFVIHSQCDKGGNFKRWNLSEYKLKINQKFCEVIK